MLRDEIIQILSEHREELREKYKVKSLALFGSVARGEERPDSDVDIFFEYIRPFGYFALAGAEEYIENLVQRHVDLIPKESIRDELKVRIFSEAIYV